MYTYTPVKPYIKEIYRLINLISDCHTVVRMISRYPRTLSRPKKITKQIALLCAKKALIGEQNQRKL